MTDVGLLLIKALASLFTVAMILSPALDMRRICAQKHTGEMALMPLVGLLMNCHMWYVTVSCGAADLVRHLRLMLAVQPSSSTLPSS